MDAAGLRALQAPIKERYKVEPKAALITLHAKGTLDDAAIACKVETGRALAVAGLHPATGGSGLELCSGDMLLEALVACAGVTLKAVATALAFRRAPARSPPKAILISAVRSALPRMRRSGSRRSGWASTSTPTRRRKNSTSCSSSPSAIASFIRRSGTGRRSRSASDAGNNPLPACGERGRVRGVATKSTRIAVAPLTLASRSLSSGRPLRAGPVGSLHLSPRAGRGNCPYLMHSMSPELLFWSALALKMVLTAIVVVVTSLVVERSGPFVGALVGALPTSAGAAYTILALEQSPDFIAASAIGSVAVNGAIGIFAATYAALAQRRGLVVSLGACLVLLLLLLLLLLV